MTVPKLDLSNFWTRIRNKAETVVANAIEWLTSRDGEPGLSWVDVQTAVEWIVVAEHNIPTGAARREWVLTQFKRISRYAADAAAEMLFWTAFNYAEKKGWINADKDTSIPRT